MLLPTNKCIYRCLQMALIEVDAFIKGSYKILVITIVYKQNKVIALDVLPKYIINNQP